MRHVRLSPFVVLLLVLLLTPSLPGARSAAAAIPAPGPVDLAAAPAASAPFFPNIRVTDDASPHAWQVEPTMQIAPTGVIYVGWKEADGADTSGRRVGYASSVDGGSTWSRNILMNQSHAGQGCANSDPWMALGPDGRLFYSYLEYECAGGLSGITVANLTDGGWPATPNYLQGAGGLSDKESMSIGPGGRVYLGWDEANLGNEMQVSWSDDEGRTWSPFVHPPDGGAVLGTIILADPVNASRVYLTWWDIYSDNILFDWSGDGGLTWHADVRVNDYPGSAAPIGAWQIPIPAMNVDPASGALYVAWPDYRNGNQDIYMARSMDHGLTWGTNHKINDDSSGHDQWMVDLAVDGTGKIHAAWEDGRTGNWNIYYANSTNGGVNWTPNLKITTEETPGSFTRPGDYFALQAGPDDTIYVVWTDGRGVDFDIYFARNPGFAAAELSLYTNPAGLQVTLDGTTAASPLRKTVLLGSTHTVSVPDPQAAGSGARYVWAAWSDGGSLSHEVAAYADLALTASFQAQVSGHFDIAPRGPHILVDNVTIDTAMTFWWDKGTDHWVEAPSPQTTAVDTRFLWASWSDGGGAAHGIEAAAPVDITATFVQEHTLRVQTDPSGISLLVDGTRVATPDVLWFPANTTHVLEADALQPGGAGVRYRFLSWSDGGARNHTILFDGAIILTARFRPEYYLTVVSPVAGATGEGWYGSGATAYATVPRDHIDEEPGHRLAFSGWGGDAAGAGLTSDSIAMDGPKTAIAAFGDEYYLEVQTPYGAAAGAGWYARDSLVTASLTSETVATAPGTRERFAGWSGDATGTALLSDGILMDAPKIAVATWTRQYLLTLRSTYGTVSGAGWYDAGASAAAALDSGTVGLAAGERARFVGWFGDASGTDPSMSSAILMDRPRVVVASWQLEYELVVRTDHGTSSGDAWYVSGSFAFASLDSGTVELADGTRAVFAGWTGNATGTSAAHSDAIFMDGPKVAVASWTLQYEFRVESGYGNATGAGWYDSGATAVAGLDSGLVGFAPGCRARFLSWSGHAAGTDSDASSPVTMDGPRLARANWKVQYTLAVQTDRGVGYGAGWFDAGSSVGVALNVDLVNTSPGTRVLFDHWAGDATGTNVTASDPIFMDGPKTAIALWKTQYEISIASAFPGVEGAGWYDAGTSVTLRAPALVTHDGRTYAFAGWTGDQTSSETNLTFVVSGPVSVQATWVASPSGDWTTGAGLAAVVLVVAAIMGLVVWRRRRKEAS